MLAVLPYIDSHLISSAGSSLLLCVCMCGLVCIIFAKVDDYLTDTSPLGTFSLLPTVKQADLQLFYCH